MNGLNNLRYLTMMGQSPQVMPNKLAQGFADVLYGSPANNFLTGLAAQYPKIDQYRNALGSRINDFVQSPAQFTMGAMGDMGLPRSSEQQFQQWIRSTPWFSEYVKQYGEEPDLNSKDYDYRAAYRAGIVPQKDPYDNNRYHWSSSAPNGQELKAKNHPTAWKEDYMRITGGRDPSDAGQPTLTPQQAAELSAILQQRYGK